MARRIRRALTFANVCSFLALTIAAGTGGAYAANTIGSADIIDGEGKTADLATDAVTTDKIKGGAVDRTDIATSAITSTKINDGSVLTSEIAANAVSGAKV